MTSILHRKVNLQTVLDFFRQDVYLAFYWW